MADVKEIYERMLLSKEPSLEKNDYQLKYILEYIPRNFDASILDAGCGNGNYSFHLADKGYTNISAVDLFSSINSDKFSYMQSSVDDMNFQDDSFDFIFSNSVIFYLDKPEQGILEFNRLHRKGGVLITTAHTKYSLFTLWRIIKRDVFKLKSMEHLKNIKFYSANDYRKMLESNGYEVDLQDGYKLSFVIFPIILKAARKLNIDNIVKIPYITKNKFLGRLKSEISYHSVLIAHKK